MKGKRRSPIQSPNKQLLNYSSFSPYIFVSELTDFQSFLLREMAHQFHYSLQQATIPAIKHFFVSHLVMRARHISSVLLRRKKGKGSWIIRWSCLPEKNNLAWCDGSETLSAQWNTSMVSIFLARVIPKTNAMWVGFQFPISSWLFFFSQIISYSFFLLLKGPHVEMKLYHKPNLSNMSS